MEEMIDGRRCWVCFLPMNYGKKAGGHDLDASLDHVGNQHRFAHRYCNSRRGAAYDPLDREMRLLCWRSLRDRYAFDDLELALSRRMLEQAEDWSPINREAPLTDGVIRLHRCSA